MPLTITDMAMKDEAETEKMKRRLTAGETNAGRESERTADQANDCRRCTLSSGRS